MSAADHRAHIINLAKQGGATLPKNGGIYWLQNLKYSHFLNVDGSFIEDGTHLIAWNKEGGKNEQFRYTTYYNGKGETVFTLECISTLESKNQIDGHGGYVRVDPSNNKVVQGGAPMPWQLIQSEPGIFQIAPFDDAFSKNGTLVITDTQPEVTTSAQMVLQLLPKKSIEEAPFEQYWIFVQLN